MKPDISQLWVFGLTTYICIQKRNKIETKAKALVLIGYDEQAKANMTLDYDRKKIVISQDVVFDETWVGFSKYQYISLDEDEIFCNFVHQNSYLELIDNLFNRQLNTPSQLEVLQSLIHSQTLQIPISPLFVAIELFTW